MNDPVERILRAFMALAALVLAAFLLHEGGSRLLRWRQAWLRAAVQARAAADAQGAPRTESPPAFIAPVSVVETKPRRNIRRAPSSLPLPPQNSNQ